MKSTLTLVIGTLVILTIPSHSARAEDNSLVEKKIKFVVKNKAPKAKFYVLITAKNSKKYMDFTVKPGQEKSGFGEVRGKRTVKIYKIGKDGKRGRNPVKQADKTIKDNDTKFTVTIKNDSGNFD